MTSTAWHGWERNIVPFLASAIPFRVLSKIPLYPQFPTKRKKSWVETGRD